MNSATPAGIFFPHLAGVQPVLQRLRPPEARDHQVVEGVLTCQGQQGSAHPHAQEHKEAGEMLDAHLQRLRGTTEAGSDAD